MIKAGSWNLTGQGKTWIYFSFFACSNALLAYLPLGLTVKLWILLFGVFLPLGLAAFSADKPSGTGGGLFTAEAFKTPSRLVWILLLALATAVRLGQVVVPGNWPTWDDGRFAYYSLELLNRWHWAFFFSPTQHPPFFNWLLFLFYHWVPPSLTALWFYPALYSIASLFLVWMTARRLFSQSLAFLLTTLMAFSFWPLYTGKFCMYMTSLVFWECLTLAVLAYWIKSGSPGRNRLGLLGLGLCLAAGFWVSISWPVVALAVGAMVGAFHRRKKPADGGFFLFLIPVLLSALLFAWVSIHWGNGVHIQQLWVWGSEESGWRRFMDAASNITSLFWGCDLQNSYGPVWGGVLNPLEGACFFLGVLECWRFRRQPWSPWLAAAFFLLLLPGLATRNFDLFRNTQVLPLLLGVTALGAQSALLSLPKRARPWTLALFLVFSAFLDLRHLGLTYRPDGAGSNRPSSLQMAAAFPLLEQTARQSGPGVLLFEVRPHETDQTLAVATYAFNATVNPSLSPGPVQWMAVVVDVHYRPFLKKRFPDGKWFDLFDPDHPGFQDTDLMLGVIPMDKSRRNTLEAWRQADRVFRKINWAVANLPENADRAENFQALSGIHSSFKGDPLLESIYWDAVYRFHRWENLYGDRDRRVHYPAALNAVREELRSGYPTAVFYNEWGTFLVLQKDYAGARKAFEKAVHSPLNLTPAAENLKALEGLGKSAGNPQGN